MNSRHSTALRCCAGLTAVLVLSSACSSDPDTQSAPTTVTCRTTSPLTDGRTPPGTNLCLGTSATVVIEADDVTATVGVKVSAITAAPAGASAAMAKAYPQDFDDSKQTMYYLRGAVTLQATKQVSAFDGDFPLSLELGLLSSSGKASSLLAFAPDGCERGRFENAKIGDTVPVCNFVFVDKDAEPVAAQFNYLTAGVPLTAPPVRWYPPPEGAG